MRRCLPSSSLVQPGCLPRSKSQTRTIDLESFSPPTMKLFSVPATLTNTDPAFIFSLLHQGVEHQAVLHQTFLTALELDGVQIAWEQARAGLVAGIKARVDITQVRQASTESTWLVFGLYLDSAMVRQTDHGVTVGVKDWMASEEDSPGFLDDKYQEEVSLHDQVMCDHKYEV